MGEAGKKRGVETGGGSADRWRRHERREVWRREVEVTQETEDVETGGGSDER